MPFIGEAHGNSIVAETPEFFDEAVVQLPRPLSCQKRNDGRPSLEELGPVSPCAVHGISECHPRRIACVPPVLGCAHLLQRGFMGEGRQWRPALSDDLALRQEFLARLCQRRDVRVPRRSNFNRSVGVILSRWAPITPAILA